MALRRLGVSPEDLRKAPPIHEMVKSIMGGKQRAIDVLRFSTDPIAIAFLECLDSLAKKDLEYLPLEALCLKAEVSPPALLGAIILAARNLHGQESALLAIVNHPEMVKRTIKSGKLLGKEGDNARRMLHEAVGFLPTKSGQSINVNLMGASPQYSQSEDEEGDDETTFNEAFPSISGKLEPWGENRRKLLEAGK